MRTRGSHVRLVTVFVAVTALALSTAPAVADEPDNQAPELGSLTITPPWVATEGGSVELSVPVADPDGTVTTVVASASSIGGDTESATLGLSTGDVWTGTLNLPANPWDWDESWTVEITAVDDLEGSTTALLGSVAQGAPPVFDQLPYVDDVTLTPQSLPATGGVVTIAGSATDDHSVSEVGGTIDDESGDGEWAIGLDPVSASGYSGAWTAPANESTDPHVYTVTVWAVDDIGQERLVNAGQVTVAGVDPPVGPDDPPEVSAASVSPTSLPEEGGVTDVSVQASDDYGIAAVSVDVSGPGIVPRTVTLSHGVGKQYAVSVQLPSNSSAAAAAYDFVLRVTDINGASVTRSLDPVVVAAADRAPLVVSASTVRMVAIEPGQRVALPVVLRNTSRTHRIVGTLGGLEAPFHLRAGARRFALDPGERVRVWVVFRATRSGRSVDRLVVVRRDGRQPRLVVRLVGRVP